MSSMETIGRDLTEWLMSSPRTANMLHLLVPALILISFTSSIGWLTWTITSCSSKVYKLGEDGGKIPATKPYMIPFLGHAISCLLDVDAIVKPQRDSKAFSIRILNHVIYLISGSENIAKLRKSKLSASPQRLAAFVSTLVLDIPKASADMYVKDVSGSSPTPSPTSNVASHNRVDYMQTDGYHRALMGKDLSKLFERWNSAWMAHVQALWIDDSWSEFPDMFSFWIVELTDAMNYAIAGPLLNKQNPRFSANLVEYFSHASSLIKGLPKWLTPGVITLRDNLIRDVTAWQAEARDLDKTDPQLDSTHWWGSAMIKERQEFMPFIDNWNHDVTSKADLGLLWGANINVHPMAIWSLVNIFQSPAVLSRLRQELISAGLNSLEMSAWEYSESLLSIPYLHAIYLESLRLHTHTFAVFYSDNQNIAINEWEIPKGHVYAVATKHVHLEEATWDPDGKHPVSEFRPERFLTLENSEEKVIQKLVNSVIPYGIGKRICPGRFFARKEINAVCAHIVQNYDIEITSLVKDHGIDPKYYGLGTSRPLHKIPFRIRRRK